MNHESVALGAGMDAVELTADSNARTFSGSLDLELDYSMQSVASKIVELEPFANDDEVAFEVSSSSPRVTLLKDVAGNLALASRDSGPAMRVDAGSFAMTSSTYAPSESVAVPAGQCLLYEAARNGTHDILRGYYAAACP